MARARSICHCQGLQDLCLPARLSALVILLLKHWLKQSDRDQGGPAAETICHHASGRMFIEPGCPHHLPLVQRHKPPVDDISALGHKSLVNAEEVVTVVRTLLRQLQDVGYGEWGHLQPQRLASGARAHAGRAQSPPDQEALATPITSRYSNQKPHIADPCFGTRTS